MSNDIGYQFVKTSVKNFCKALEKYGELRYNSIEINIRGGVKMSNLVVYFSRKGENYWNGIIKNLTKGNTERIAEFIHKAVGGDLFEVKTVREYPEDYEGCINQAQKELNANARPQLQSYLDNLDKYNTVFVGFPNWWGTMPMAMFTFLEHYNMSGKKIIPFCTNEGSGMGSSEIDLKHICRGANILSGLSIHGAESAVSERRVAEWARNSLR